MPRKLLFEIVCRKRAQVEFESVKIKPQSLVLRLTFFFVFGIPSNENNALQFIYNVAVLLFLFLFLLQSPFY